MHRITKRIPLPSQVRSNPCCIFRVTLPVSPVRSVPPHLPNPSPIRSPKMLLTMSLLFKLSVTESTPSTFTPLCHSSIPQAAPSSPSISFDMSILWPTAFAYTSQELTRLSIDESPSSESSSIITSSSLLPTLMPTAILSLSVFASSLLPSQFSRA